MPKKTLYILILGFALAGYSWVILNHFLIKSGTPVVNVCLFRVATGIPCPSCGTTHAVLSIAKGDFIQALRENVLGFPVTLMLVVIPAWIVADLLGGKESFYRFYFRMEIFLRRRWVAWSALFLILANWAWSIYMHS